MNTLDGAAPIRARRTQAERSEATQAQIIEATLTIIQQRGVQTATLHEIARQAGVSSGALQHHFGSKAALVQRTIDFVFEESEDDGSVWPDPDLALPARATDFIDRAWRFIYGKPSYIASWHLHFACQSSEKLRTQLNERREPWDQRMTRLFLERFPEVSRHHPDPKGFARLVFSSLRGIAILVLFGDVREKNADQLAALATMIAGAGQQRGAVASAPSVASDSKPRRPVRRRRARGLD